MGSGEDPLRQAGSPPAPGQSARFRLDRDGGVSPPQVGTEDPADATRLSTKRQLPIMHKEWAARPGGHHVLVVGNGGAGDGGQFLFILHCNSPLGLQCGPAGVQDRGAFSSPLGTIGPLDFGLWGFSLCSHGAHLLHTPPERLVSMASPEADCPWAACGIGLGEMTFRLRLVFTQGARKNHWHASQMPQMRSTWCCGWKRVSRRTRACRSSSPGTT